MLQLLLLWPQSTEKYFEDTERSRNSRRRMRAIRHCVTFLHHECVYVYVLYMLEKYLFLMNRLVKTDLRRQKEFGRQDAIQPYRTFHNFRASKSVERRFWATYSASISGSWSSKTIWYVRLGAVNELWYSCATQLSSIYHFVMTDFSFLRRNH